LYADLHIHSHYSRATSKNLDFEHLAQWAQIKGVNIVGTGDISHPGWLQEMREKLEPAEDGLFRLRPEFENAIQTEVPKACRAPVRFLLSGEISNIYKRHDAVRKVHNVIFAPSLEAVDKLQVSLEQIGNIRSDGRPILGLDSHDLLEITLETDPRCHFIPAHIWTPWFSMLGSKSGFDSVEECFGDLTDHIFALETGLSSDPPMNWRVSNLDRYTLVSNSDAHSPQKLAREATVFTTEMAYDALFDALHTGDSARFGGTIEFFPEEGKYHLDGHRKCGVAWEPATTIAHDGLCSVCGKKVTVGVMHRVDSLADRPVGGKPARTHPYISLVPLPEVLGEVHSVGPNTRTVQRAYFKLLDALGPELAILRDVPLEDIAAAGGAVLAEGIGRMRAGQVVAQGGYDGEYGVIKVLPDADGSDAPEGLFPADEVEALIEVSALREPEPSYGEPRDSLDEGTFARDSGASTREWTALPLFELPAPASDEIPWLERLNDEQRSAVECTDVPLIISAGPGTGKTRTLTVRIAHLVRSLGVSPEAILAITFTNKAAEEMAGRMAALIGEGMAARLTIKTFHAFGALLLRQYGDAIGVSSNFAIAGEQEQRTLLRRAFPEWNGQEVARYLLAISDAKSRLLLADSPGLDVMAEELPDIRSAYRAYSEALSESNLLDFDDLILLAVRLLETDAGVRAHVHARYTWISVDEYQDVNQSQYRLLRLLTSGDANLCVIGDPDQAIYGFRGADRRYFLAFASDYASARTLHLRHSYRSPQTLLDAASQVITHNPDREAVALVSEFVEQVKLDVYRAPTDRAEAEYIVHSIEQMVGGTSYFSLDSGRVDDAGEDAASGSRTFGDFAVLYRLHAQSVTLLEAFDRSGIPYQCASTASPYGVDEARTLLAYLWLLNTPNSMLHWEAVLTS
ncbi:MAG: UvrD-helicase domain-containing protein, partial [Caldilineaceae bacterium]